MEAGFAKGLYRTLSAKLKRKQRGRISFEVSSDTRTTPTVYFLAPDYDLPSGGTMVLYRHVDILNAAGINAVALHTRPGFRYTWFENQTRTTDLAATTIGYNDLLVVPELDIDLLDRLPIGVRYVIFNQNSHLTWTRAPASVGKYYRNSHDLAAIITVSAHNQTMLRYAFKDTPVHRLHLGINERQFWAPEGQRLPRITYMPRRGSDDAAQVLALLKGRGALDGWEVVPLDGLRHAEVAAQLRDSTIFLAFTYQEGFGLPAAEAMACGNYVIGYHGFGGREFFNETFSAPIDTGDVLGFAKAVEAAIYNEHFDPGWCRQRGTKASSFLSANYGMAREQTEIAALYGEILNATAASTTKLGSLAETVSK